MPLGNHILVDFGNGLVVPGGKIGPHDAFVIVDRPGFERFARLKKILKHILQGDAASFLFLG